MCECVSYSVSVKWNILLLLLLDQSVLLYMCVCVLFRLEANCLIVRVLGRFARVVEFYEPVG